GGAGRGTGGIQRNDSKAGCNWLQAKDLARSRRTLAKDYDPVCSAPADSESESDSDAPPLRDRAVAASPLTSPFQETPCPLRLPFSVSFTPSGESVTIYGLPSISISRFSSLSSLVAISPSLESVEKGFYRTQANRRNETRMIRLEIGHGASIGRSAENGVG